MIKGLKYTFLLASRFTDFHVTRVLSIPNANKKSTSILIFMLNKQQITPYTGKSKKSMSIFPIRDQWHSLCSLENICQFCYDSLQAKAMGV